MQLEPLAGLRFESEPESELEEVFTTLVPTLITSVTGFLVTSVSTSFDECSFPLRYTSS